MKTEILTLLRNTTASISGQEICEHLGVSRTAVWKVINQLKEEGYEIEALQNKGYRILQYPDILTESEIVSRLHTKWAGQKTMCFTETASTNAEAKKHAEEEDSHGMLFVADQQSAGRGRRGRNWESPAGSSIYMSIVLRPDFAPDKASMLTLLMALAVGHAVKEISGMEAAIKWPNDIVVNGKKICGILTEMSAELDYIHYVVTGVGINVNQEVFPEEIMKMATSLSLEGGRQYNRAELIERCMYYFEQYYENFLKDLSLVHVKEEYNSFLINRGKEVRVLDPQGEYNGIALGINDSGELLVKKENEEVVEVYAGEVSVRGLYGYV